MKRFLLASSISLMLLSTAAMAAPGHGNGNGHGGGNPHAGPAAHGDHGDRHDAYESGHHYRYAKGHRVHHDNGLHLGQYKFERGARVPAAYLEPRYVVQDYRVYNLAPPPRGYRWVRPDDGRYLLISTATGLISQILGY